MNTSLLLKFYIIYFVGSLIVFQRDLYAIVTLSSYAPTLACLLSLWFFGIPLLVYATLRRADGFAAHAIDKRD